MLSKSALIVLLLGVCFASGGFLFIENLVRQEERANFKIDRRSTGIRN